jgi:hypothetical protein
MVSKVEKLSPDIQEEILKLIGQGLPNGEVANQMNANKNLDLNEYDVSAFLKRNEGKAIKAMKFAGEFEKQMAEKYFNSITQMNDLNKEMWQHWYESKKDAEKDKIIDCPHCHKGFKIKIKDYQVIVKLADSIMNQIKHVDTIIGRMAKKTMSFNYNVVDINNKITQALPNIIERMEKDGRLEALSRRLKKQKKKMLIVQSDEEEDLDGSEETD